MALRRYYTKFDADTTSVDMNIPDQSSEHDIGSGKVTNVEFVPLPAGGVHDTLGTSDGDMSNRRFTVKGAVTKNFLNSTNGSTMDTAFQKIMGYAGKRGTLYRTADKTSPATANEHAKVRLMEVKTKRTPGDTWMVPIELDFMMVDRCWYGSARAYTIALEATATTFNLTNGGDTIITNPIFKLNQESTAGVSACTGLRLEKIVGATVYGDLNYVGTVTTSQQLIIDCGARAVTLDGSDAYVNFSLGTGQRSDGWIRLGAGDNSIRATLTGATVTSTAPLYLYVSYEYGYR